MPMRLFTANTADEVSSYVNKNKVTAAAVVAGGTGYAIDDIIEVLGGVGLVSAFLKVSGVAGDVINAVTVERKGQYTTNPSNPVSTQAVVGTGSGATFNLTMASDAVPQANIVDITHRASVWYLQYWE